MAKKNETSVGTKEATKKRTQYQERECPYCHQLVRNLPNHIRLKHPGESGSETPEPPAISKESLLGGEKPKAEPGPASNVSEKTYYCTGCNKARVRKGEETCWKCGAYLNWEGID